MSLPEPHLTLQQDVSSLSRKNLDQYLEPWLSPLVFQRLCLLPHPGPSVTKSIPPWVSFQHYLFYPGLRPVLITHLSINSKKKNKVYLSICSFIQLICCSFTSETNWVGHLQFVHFAQSFCFVLMSLFHFYFSQSLGCALQTSNINHWTWTCISLFSLSTQYLLILVVNPVAPAPWHFESLKVWIWKKHKEVKSSQMLTIVLFHFIRFHCYTFVLFWHCFLFSHFFFHSFILSFKWVTLVPQHFDHFVL